MEQIVADLVEFNIGGKLTDVLQNGGDARHAERLNYEIERRGVMLRMKLKRWSNVACSNAGAANDGKIDRASFQEPSNVSLPGSRITFGADVK